MFLNLLEKFAQIEDVAKNFLCPTEVLHNVIQIPRTIAAPNGDFVVPTQNIVNVQNV